MKRAHSLSSVLLLVPSLALISHVPQNEASPTPSVVERIRERCQAELESIHGDSEFPGGSAAILLPDGTELALTVGVDSEGGRPISPTDRFLSGSIGKSYVAAVALHLVELGKLELDAPAHGFFEGEEWFGRLAGWETMTVRHLLHHQSGLRRYVFDRGFWDRMHAEPAKVWEPQELLAYVFDQPGLFEPGQGWAYADTNYIVLGMILERVSSSTVYDYVREHLLEPHGLEDTIPSDRRRLPGLVQGLTAMFLAPGAEGGPQPVLVDGEFLVNPQFEWCGGGFCSTPMDLARWTRLYYSGRAFEGDYLRHLTDGVEADPRYFGLGATYGPGCIRRETDLGVQLGHDGVMVGYQSSTGWFVEHELAVTFQINLDRDTRMPLSLNDAVIRLANIAVEELAR